jgi:hypothetical protein
MWGTCSANSIDKSFQEGKIEANNKLNREYVDYGDAEDHSLKSAHTCSLFQNVHVATYDHMFHDTLTG